jgi:hypothetical protein
MIMIANAAILKPGLVLNKALEMGIALASSAPLFWV